jgi:predicted amidohydrolase
MRLGLAQVDCDLGNVEANLVRAREIVEEAKGRGVDLVVFPELNLTGYSLGEATDEIALELQDERVASFIEEVKDISVVLGFYEDGNGIRTYNSSIYIEEGSVLRLHRKMYLPTYGVFEERKYFSPGQSMRAFNSRFGRMAMLICNDAWQPVLSFLAVQDGAEVLLVPSNSAESNYPDVIDSREYWKDITRFYARMLESYVVFVNRVGTEGSLTFWGGSHVVDPKGQLVQEGPAHKECLLTVDVDVKEVRRRRRQVPLVKEARLALLSKELNRLVEEGGDL